MVAFSLPLSAVTRLLIVVFLTRFTSAQLNILWGNFTDEIDRSSVMTALRGVQYAYYFAYYRTKRLQLALGGGEPAPDPILTKGSDFSTFMLFESLFGRGLYEKGGIDKVSLILGKLEKIEYALRDPSLYVDLRNDDGFLRPLDLPEVHPERGYWYDSRPREWGGHYKFKPIGESGRSCIMPDLGGWTLTIDHVPSKKIELLVVCPNTLVEARRNPGKIDILQTRLQDLSDIGSNFIGQIANWNLAQILIHEFTHMKHILGVDGALDDHVWGFSDCFNLAKQSPHLAINNADSLAYYVFALLFDRYDWSTGFAESVPPDFQGPLQRLFLHRVIDRETNQQILVWKREGGGSYSWK